MRTQRHKARHARAVARFGQSDAVANARGDSFVESAGSFWQFRHQALALGARRFELLFLNTRLLVESLEPLFHVGAEPLNFRRSFLQFFLGLVENFHLLEFLRLKCRDLFAGRVGFTNCGRVFVGFLGGHQISIGALGPLLLIENLFFQAGAFMKSQIATFFEGPNFKGALIELFFDLGAPVRDAFYFSL